MPFLSYAQNAEDVPLWRVFGGQPDGFYVDVGASSPDESVTRAFYQAGWTGLNLEPLPELFAQVCAARPRDLNLAVAASDRRGTATLFSTKSGLSTLDADQSDRLSREGVVTTPVEVPLVPLAELFAEHVTRPIDFLKVDVEGHERQVLAGNDWARWRPRVVLVEATAPNSRTPNHHGWEPILLAADYHFALFDGLNRFYVRGEDRHLIDPLGVSANFFDDYQTFAHHTAVARTAELGERLHALSEQHHTLSEQSHALAGTHRELGEAHDALSRSHHELNQQHNALSQSHQELSQQHDTLSRRHHDLNQLHHELTQQHAALNTKQAALTQQHERAVAESADRLAQLEDTRRQLATLSQQHHALSEQHHALSQQHHEVATDNEERRKQLEVLTADHRRYSGWLGPFWWVRGRVVAAVRLFRTPPA